MAKDQSKIKLNYKQYYKCLKVLFFMKFHNLGEGLSEIQREYCNLVRYGESTVA